MMKRTWIRSGIVEELDKSQVALLDHVLAEIERYYRDLYQTQDRYKYPLSLSRLMKMTKRSGTQVLNAIRLLANTSVGEDTPCIYYDRIAARDRRNRPYRIFLR